MKSATRRLSPWIAGMMICEGGRVKPAPIFAWAKGSGWFGIRRLGRVWETAGVYNSTRPGPRKTGRAEFEYAIQRSISRRTSASLHELSHRAAFHCCGVYPRFTAIGIRRSRKPQRPRHTCMFHSAGDPCVGTAAVNRRVALSDGRVTAADCLPRRWAALGAEFKRSDIAFYFASARDRMSIGP